MTVTTVKPDDRVRIFRITAHNKNQIVKQWTYTSLKAYTRWITDHIDGYKDSYVLSGEELVDGQWILLTKSALRKKTIKK